MDTNAKLRQLAQAWNDAWNSRVATQLTAFFGDTGTYYEPGLDSGPVTGAGIAAVAERTWKEWPSATFSMRSLTIEAPRVVLEWHSSAAHVSGKIVNLEGVDVLEWDGERITSARVYYDMHARNAALGG